MTSLFKNKLLAVGLVALVQTMALVWMIADRVSLLKSGREIVLPVVPVDPRDLFRGDYVTLSYDISRLRLDGEAGRKRTSKTSVYAVVKKTPDGSWKADRLVLARPAQLASDEQLIQGRFDSRWGGGFLGAWSMPHYGIEKYFVPEGTGPELEKAAREKKLAAVIAVDKNGRAALKGLVIDGKVRYEEPLF